MNCQAATHTAGRGHLAPGLAPGAFSQQPLMMHPAHRQHHLHQIGQAVPRHQSLGPKPRPANVHRVPTVPQIVPVPTRPDRGPRSKPRLSPTRPDPTAPTPTRGPRTLVLGPRPDPTPILGARTLVLE